ncbi:hypothetical protein ScalyP_jg7750 [Parmales sp. scaly parma]|nr:hypothetical protein ScalyP_jg7750 [Parmales sp. scaly parma]
MSQIKNYSDASYWEKRYADDMSSDASPQTFEWLASLSKSSNLKDTVMSHYSPFISSSISTTLTPPNPTPTPTPIKLLHVGCGDSLLGIEIENCFAELNIPIKVCNVDISPSVINKMRTLYPTQLWVVGDASQPPATPPSPTPYHLILDKGTLDLFCCSPGVKADKINAVEGYLDYCCAYLPKNGIWLAISFGIPETRLELLKKASAESNSWGEIKCSPVVVNKESGGGSGEGVGVSSVYVYSMKKIKK